MVNEPATTRSRFSDGILSDAQQVAAGSILFVCLLLLLGAGILRRVGHQERIDIERPFDKREVQFTIDINEADWPEFTLLPEVSETLARRIVEYREAKGQFGALDELKRVQGIGPRTLDMIYPFLEPLSENESTPAGRLSSTER